MIRITLANHYLKIAILDLDADLDADADTDVVFKDPAQLSFIKFHESLKSVGEILEMFWT